MEAKLKTLKVADLKDILAKAQQPPPPKATKSDLIARILASKEATDVYNAKFAPKDDLLAPPEEYVPSFSLFLCAPTTCSLDWDVDQVNPPETSAEPPVSRVPCV
jgi:SAP domain-containing ribonucleoprotein